MSRPALLDKLAAYEPWDLGDAAMAARVRSFVESQPACALRETAEGHLTGSAWIVNRRGDRVLLLQHKKLAKWLQPGGHADGELNLLDVAMREASEETGLDSLTPLNGEIFDVDIHEIPARGSEAAHLHYDVRFVVVADDAEPLKGNSESDGLRWIELHDLESMTAERSMVRMRDKWMAFTSRLSSQSSPPNE